jgi:hypothetical protein
MSVRVSPCLTFHREQIGYDAAKLTIASRTSRTLRAYWTRGHMQADGDRNQMPRFSELSGPRQVLVRLCQTINHGHLEALRIADGEPAFTPAPIVLLDVKLDQDEEPRPEVELVDFELSSEVRRLMSRIDAIKDGKVSRLEIRGGVPRRVIFESTMSGQR